MVSIVSLEILFLFVDLENLPPRNFLKLREMYLDRGHRLRNQRRFELMIFLSVEGVKFSQSIGDSSWKNQGGKSFPDGSQVYLVKVVSSDEVS